MWLNQNYLNMIHNHSMRSFNYIILALVPVFINQLVNHLIYLFHLVKQQYLLRKKTELKAMVILIWCHYLLSLYNNVIKKIKNAIGAMIHSCTHARMLSFFCCPLVAQFHFLYIKSEMFFKIVYDSVNMYIVSSQPYILPIISTIGL